MTQPSGLCAFTYEVYADRYAELIAAETKLNLAKKILAGMNGYADVTIVKAIVCDERNAKDE